MTNIHIFKTSRMAIVAVAAALLAASCGSDTPEAASPPTTTSAEPTEPTPTRTEHPCETEQAQHEDRYCYVDGQWYISAGANFWNETDGPPTTTTPTTTTTTVVTSQEPETCEGQVRIADRDVDVWMTPDEFCLPDDCENDLARGDGECDIANGKTYTITDNGEWELAAAGETAPAPESEIPEPDTAPEAPEPVPETTVPETEAPEPVTPEPEPVDEPQSAGCDDLAAAGAAVTSSRSTEIPVDLSETGRWQWTVCVASNDPAARVVVEGISNSIPGADWSVAFPSMNSTCSAEQTGSDPARFMLAFSVTDDAYDPDREPEPCFNPVVDGSRGAWAGNYRVWVRVGASEYEAYFLAERLGD